MTYRKFVQLKNHTLNNEFTSVGVAIAIVKVRDWRIAGRRWEWRRRSQRSHILESVIVAIQIVINAIDWWRNVASEWLHRWIGIKFRRWCDVDDILVLAAKWRRCGGAHSKWPWRRCCYCRCIEIVCKSIGWLVATHGRRCGRRIRDTRHWRCVGGGTGSRRRSQVWWWCGAVIETRHRRWVARTGRSVVVRPLRLIDVTREWNGGASVDGELWQCRCWRHKCRWRHKRSAGGRLIRAVWVWRGRWIIGWRCRRIVSGRWCVNRLGGRIGRLSRRIWSWRNDQRRWCGWYVARLQWLQRYNGLAGWQRCRRAICRERRQRGRWYRWWYRGQLAWSAKLGARRAIPIPVRYVINRVNLAVNRIGVEADHYSFSAVHVAGLFHFDAVCGLVSANERDGCGREMCQWEWN